MTAHLLHLPVTGKHHESKRVLKLLVIRSADRDLCIIRKYNALMTVSTYSMKINGKAVMAETEIWFHSFCKSCQAVGGAVGHNRVSVIVPCHRVIGLDGSLTGYAGGIERKIRLLNIEQPDLIRTIPKF